MRRGRRPPRGLLQRRGREQRRRGEGWAGGDETTPLADSMRWGWRWTVGGFERLSGDVRDGGGR